jgi:uncharacterized protein (TIGR00255 family)
MTGFGVGESRLGEGKVTVEVRALNHRFLEVRVRVPNEIGDQSFFVEQLARERLTRGRFEIGVRLDGAALPPPRFSTERARAAYRAMLELRDELAPRSEVPLAAIFALPSVLAATSQSDTEALSQSLRGGLMQAIEDLDRMRQREGDALRRELVQRLESARRLRAEFASRAENVVTAYRTRLRERLERLLGDTGVALDAGRLEAELAVMADRSDVTEELVRLGSHFDQFEQLLDSGESVGRRLDFLLQEIGREANTIGAKSQDASLSHLVVELKAEVERMREQVQNVE